MMDRLIFVGLVAAGAQAGYWWYIVRGFYQEHAPSSATKVHSKLYFPNRGKSTD